MCQCLRSVFYARHDDINARINNINAQQKTLDKICFKPEETYDTQVYFLNKIQKTGRSFQKSSKINRNPYKDKQTKQTYKETKKTRKEESKYMKT